MTPDLHVEQIKITSIRPHPDSPLVHPKKQIHQIAESIKAFYFRMPVLVGQDTRLIYCHARVDAFKLKTA